MLAIALPSRHALTFAPMSIALALFVWWVVQATHRPVGPNAG
jgi:hypothetical protein